MSIVKYCQCVWYVLILSISFNQANALTAISNDLDIFGENVYSGFCGRDEYIQSSGDFGTTGNASFLFTSLSLDSQTREVPGHHDVPGYSYAKLFFKDGEFFFVMDALIDKEGQSLIIKFKIKLDLIYGTVEDFFTGEEVRFTVNNRSRKTLLKEYFLKLIEGVVIGLNKQIINLPFYGNSRVYIHKFDLPLWNIDWTVVKKEGILRLKFMANVNKLFLKTKRR